MFTGIIQAIGAVRYINRKNGIMQLGVSVPFANEVKIGDSIAVNGVCLTIVKIGANIIYFDAGLQAQKDTNLSDLRLNDIVNIEQALKPHDRLGGHIVTGHIDTIGIIRRKQGRGQQAVFEIALKKGLTANIVKKGSIAVDGISLTVNAVKDDAFTVSIIPHTLKNTGLNAKRIGGSVNIEFDILAKYARSSYDKPLFPAQSRITKNFLKEQGFLS